jgi:hypothetical protein
LGSGDFVVAQRHFDTQCRPPRNRTLSVALVAAVLAAPAITHAAVPTAKVEAGSRQFSPSLLTREAAQAAATTAPAGIGRRTPKVMSIDITDCEPVDAPAPNAISSGDRH